MTSRGDHPAPGRCAVAVALLGRLQAAIDHPFGRRANLLESDELESANGALLRYLLPGCHGEMGSPSGATVRNRRQSGESSAASAMASSDDRRTFAEPRLECNL